MLPVLWGFWSPPRSFPQPSIKQEDSLDGRSILESPTSIPLSPRPRTKLHATISTQGQSHELLALVDSGADESFLDLEVVKQLSIPTVELPKPIVANAD